MTTVTINGKTVDFAAAVNLMDDEIREELHSAQDWQSDQDFTDAYILAHDARFGEEFIFN